MKDYDYIGPLACGDVTVEAVALTLERDTEGAMERALNDPAVDAGELSLSRYVIRRAQGDRGFVGLPFFAYRAFRQRCFFVLAGSGITELRQLAGKRVATNEWPASGNVWSRALLRDQGVSIDSIRWFVGPADSLAGARRPQGTLPPFVQLAPPDRTLREMLLAGDVEALMIPRPPAGFYEPNSPIVRVYPDYPRVEREYYRRTGLYPPQHIIGMRREVFERHPWVAANLYQALERSRLLWQRRCAAWAEGTPWYLAELEDVSALFGRDWQPNGVGANRAAIQAFCDEEFAQGLIPEPMDGARLFADFEQVMRS
jgi:4,5-dihydroxyphthalate decarboxylase